ncbi:MAG: tetratricopeptide repeat protein, partial [Phycisphaerae bacterium]|nr:tetratricopeptide repeat protein [Saprospiraceae bacterium]
MKNTLLLFVFIVIRIGAFAQNADSLRASKEVFILIDSAAKLTDQQYFDQAFQVLEFAGKQAEDKFGKKSYQNAKALNFQGRNYVYAGKYQEALPFFESCLQIYEGIKGPPADVAIVHSNIGMVYRNLGLYEQAEPYYLAAHKIRKQTQGELSKPFAGSLNSLGLLAWNQGHYTLAEHYHKKAMEIRLKLFGDQHIDYAQSMNNLAILYNDMGLMEKAEPLYLQSMALRKKLLGPEHP